MIQSRIRLTTEENPWLSAPKFTSFADWYEINTLLYGGRFYDLANKPDEMGYLLIHEAVMNERIDFVDGIVGKGLNSIDAKTIHSGSLDQAGLPSI